MCLYQIKLKNPHYLKNEKNKGIIPPIEDERKLYINTNCGWCIECRKQIANEWRIRLYEELKTNQNAEFVTLTFSPQSIQQLENEIFTKKYKGLEKGDLDVNILAAYAIRMFTERWRKKYKHAPRHFLVTELGHKGSERIHLHGIIFNTTGIEKKTFQKDITEKWQYGQTYIGQWVDNRTINYIIKYITKIDTINNGYKQKIFCSKGLGKEYIKIGKQKNAFQGEKTNQNYTTHNGIKLNLPKYYKNKIYTTEEKDKLWTYALDKGEIYLNGDIYYLEQQDDEQYRQKFFNALKSRRETNQLAKYGTNEKTIEKYIITEKMKLSKEELDKNPKEQVKKATRREIIKTIKNNDEYQNISKTYDTTQIIYGEYEGNLTDGERKLNRLITQAQREKISVRQLRLKLKGLPY